MGKGGVKRLGGAKPENFFPAYFLQNFMESIKAGQYDLGHNM